VLALVVFSTLTALVVASDVGDTSVITSLNYGVVIKRITTIDVVTGLWNEAFIVSLPRQHNLPTKFDELDCSERMSRANRTTCLRLRPVVYYLQNISSRAVVHIHGVISQIRSLVMEHIPTRRQTEKKGLMDAGGYLLHGLFGVARDSDINHVRHAVAEIRR